MSRRKNNRNSTVSNVAVGSTNINDVLAGSLGHAARGFVLGTLASQTAFNLGRAYTATQRKAETPVFDADIANVLGDAGLPETKPLDLGECIKGNAAAFMLLTNHIRIVNPETGKRDEHLKRFLKHPKSVIENAVDFRAARQITEAQATARQLYGKWRNDGEGKPLVCTNPDECNAKAQPRIDAIKAEAAATVNAAVAPVVQQFLTCLATYKNYTDDELANVALTAMIGAGDVPSIKVKEAAKAFLTSRRKAMDEGKFVRIDNGIYALAG